MNKIHDRFNKECQIEKEASRITSRFLAYVSEWMVVAFIEIVHTGGGIY